MTAGPTQTEHGETDLARVDAILGQYDGNPAKLIAVLQDIQEEYRYLPREALVRVAAGLELPVSQVYRVATFYTAFRLKPLGRHLISVCTGTACHVRGAPVLLDRLGHVLDIPCGGTTPDQRFTLESVHCMGCCSLAPAVRVDTKVFGRLRVGDIDAVLEDFR
jgi:NADH-quinone oxidoreductase subunit E